MSGFLTCPNLPQGRVERAIIGERYRSLLSQPLAELGISVLWMPDIAALSQPVRGHADMAILHLGGNRFIAAAELPREILNELTKLGAELLRLEAPLSNKYPADCPLNIALLGKYVIMNPDTAAPLPNSGLTRISVKQGYSRCSVCIVDESSIITSDAGISRAAEKEGLDVLLISADGIELRGYASGFIGGCAFKLAPNVLAFTGSLDEHKDGARISAFLSERRITPLCLTQGPLVDIGGAVLVTGK